MMQRRQRNTSLLFEGRLLHFGRKLVIYTITCGLLLHQTVSQADNSDQIYFPGPSSRSNHRVLNEPPGGSDLDYKMLSASLQFARRMSSVESYEEYLKFIGVSGEADIQIDDRFGDGQERSNAERPTFARCEPQNTTVSLRTDNNPAISIFPPCTRIKRCGGCCLASLLSCQPISTITRNFKVAVHKLNKDLEFNYEGEKIVTLEEHTKCTCDCKVKPEHCNQKQIYDKNICKCICTNTDEEQKCRSNNNTKLWDIDNCTCLCREVNECATGFYFDKNTCRCQKLLPRLHNFSTRTGYILGQTQSPESIPPVIVTLDPADPRRKPKDDPER